MNFFEWNQQLSVGNPQIDADHQTLIGLVNEFGDTAAKHPDATQLERILQKLIEYTSTHFEREETLMREIGYAKTREHLNQHAKLLARVHDLQKEMQLGRISIAIETAELLRFWLTSHIMLSDRDLAEAIHSRAA
ncbi:bacteriohemerythrin [Undibacterium cyanobacteriorum]|uniref:Bacteriohemerythrin n=1 Tax=Undibacterium cyanobacteriorum TaxID=3073561 RepID=A0ABY9RKK8_9BURK|nr:bacteriohemerythrin [Undibacterium sp. 20NA77.5]WMW81749.1 bacteriohemerythrin [Undibacterium sp. 20NA77.5]